MCGRFNLIATRQQIMDHFGLPSLPARNPDYNSAGPKNLAVVQLEDGGNRVVYPHWGLISSWPKDRHLKMLANIDTA